MLTFDKVLVSQGNKNIVKCVDFTAKRNQITVLLGKNGSGKSTLIRCVNGLCAYEGEIRLEGENLRNISPLCRARRLSILPQLLPETAMTVEELCAQGRYPYSQGLGFLTEEDRRWVDTALKTVGMDKLKRRLVSTLSGGERQRAFVAMILAQNTETVIMDEATASMDVDVRRQWADLCRQLKKEGKTLLLILHDLSEAMALADRVVILEEGAAVFEGTKEECLQHQAVESAFNVRRYECDGTIFFK